jgi:RimJ/RimL family protein N-acetyltransferase
MDAANFSVAETLRSGKKVEIRALKLTDREGLERALNRESEQSLYRRFFTIKRHFSDKEADFFLNIDFVKHVALVATVTEGGKSVIIGGGRYVSVRPNEAEVAFSIVDEYQGQGLGTLLMQHLTAIASASGFETLLAEVLPNNAPMLKVFAKCGHPTAKTRRDGTVHVVIDLKSRVD